MKATAMTTCFVFAALAATAQMREWKATTGQTLQAEFVEIKEGRVVLKHDGGLASPPLDALAPESRDLALAIHARNEKLRIEALTPAQMFSIIEPRNFMPPGAPLQPVLATSEIDVFVVDLPASIFFFFKEDGAYRSPPLSLGLEINYVDTSTEKRHVRHRRPREILARTLTQKGDFTIRRKHDDDVVSEIHLTLGRRSVSAGYQVVDPPGIQFPSHQRFVMRVWPVCAITNDVDGIPSIYHSPRVASPGVSRDDLLAVMESWRLNFLMQKEVKGAKTSFQYWDSVQGFPRPTAGVIEMAGGVFGPSKLAIVAGSAGSLSARIYQGKAPMDGFVIYYGKSNPASRADGVTGMLKLELR